MWHSPTASSKSWPGVRMVVATRCPSRRISRGSSTMSSSGRRPRSPAPPASKRRVRTVAVRPLGMRVTVPTRTGDQTGELGSPPWSPSRSSSASRACRSATGPSPTPRPAARSWSSPRAPSPRVRCGAVRRPPGSSPCSTPSAPSTGWTPWCSPAARRSAWRPATAWSTSSRPAAAGFDTPAGPVPIVVGLSLFDLFRGDGRVRPGPQEGRTAAVRAIESDSRGPGGAGPGRRRHGVLGGLLVRRGGPRATARSSGRRCARATWWSPPWWPATRWAAPTTAPPSPTASTSCSRGPTRWRAPTR